MSLEESSTAQASAPKPPANKHGGPLEVFLAFLKLGLTSFGGPIAHLGYFREAFVVKRGWLDDRSYADLVALCQFLVASAACGSGPVADPQAGRRVLPRGLSCVRRRTRRLAAASSGRRPARLGQQRRMPPRLCSGPSSPSPPISARRWDRLQTAGRARLSV